MSITRRRLFTVGAVVVLLVAAVAVVLVLRSREQDDSRLAAAVALAPEGSARLSWTDWAAVRKELDSDVSAASSADEVDGFLGQGFDADLTSTSALPQSTRALQESYGVSPASLEWELLNQGEDGALLLLGLPESLDTAEFEDTLAGLGYQEPDESDGTWTVSADTLATLGGITPELANISIDPEHRVLAASDESESVDGWRDDQRGDDDDGVTEVVGELDDAVSASIYTGDHACVALAMNQADETDRARAAQLLAEAGDISPIRGFAIAAWPGGDVRVAMAFETSEQARTNADTRGELAAGPAPGQGGDFADRFELGGVTADDTVVTMELEPLPGAFVLSDLATGPVLFATC